MSTKTKEMVLYSVLSMLFISFCFLTAIFSTTLINVWVLAIPLPAILAILISLNADLTIEFFGKKPARLMLIMGVIARLILVFMMLLALTVLDTSDATKEMARIVIRGVIGGIGGMVITQWIDINVYSYLYKKYPSFKHLWIRNKGSVVVSQLVFSVFANTVIFYSLVPVATLLQIIASSYVVKLGISLIDTAFLYPIVAKLHSMGFESRGDQ